MAKMHHEIPPNKVLLKELDGAQEFYLPAGSDILVATYVPPEKTKGGIIWTDKTRGENEYQGRVGLVLKLGPLVKSKEIDEWFAGRIPQIGDWVVFRGSDTYTFKLNGVPCRTVEAKNLRGIVADPDLIW